MQEIDMKLQGICLYNIRFIAPGIIIIIPNGSLKSDQPKQFIYYSDCRSKIKEKQTYIIQYETELQTVKFKSDSLSVNRMFAVKKKMDALKKEVRHLMILIINLQIMA